ncbi:DUF202 domain-containing protein, partial [Brevibacillus thermoruber]
MEKTTDSKFVQQHLANERTFLAWIRTSITIVGLGFLAVGVVFRTSPYTQLGHLISSIVGIGSVLFGTVLVILSTKEYLKKRAGINNETWYYPLKVDSKKRVHDIMDSLLLTGG